MYSKSEMKRRNNTFSYSESIDIAPRLDFGCLKSYFSWLAIFFKMSSRDFKNWWNSVHVNSIFDFTIKMDFKVSIESLALSFFQILFALAKIRSAGADVPGKQSAYSTMIENAENGTTFKQLNIDEAGTKYFYACAKFVTVFIVTIIFDQQL